MAVIKSSVLLVLEKFPDRGGDITRLYKENPEFQTLCEDYRLCTEALQHWNQSNKKEAPARRREYEELLQELVDEVWMCLKKSI